MKHFMAVFLCLMTGFGAFAQTVDEVLNDWHDAAAQADFDRYFSHFNDDNSIFLGTDATERWTVAEFAPWAKPYFDRGSAWEFIPQERWVYLSEDGNTAWFDETLSSEHMGPCRGSGALVLTEEGWKITHYNLTVPIPNAILSDVVEQISNAE